MALPKPQPIDPDDGTPIVSKYKADDFICAPADAKGVSYRLTFRCIPDIEKGIDQIVASNRFPFSTRGDVIRWCIREGLRALNQMEPVISVQKRVDMVDSLMVEEAAHSSFMHIFDVLEENVSKYMADQAPKQALRVLAMARHNFESMPEGHWRERYLEELHKRFGQLLATGKGVTIAPNHKG